MKEETLRKLLRLLSMGETKINLKFQFLSLVFDGFANFIKKYCWNLEKMY